VHPSHNDDAVALRDPSLLPTKVGSGNTKVFSLRAKRLDVVRPENPTDDGEAQKRQGYPTERNET